MNLFRASAFFFLILLVAFSSCEPNNPFGSGPPYDEAGNLKKDSLLIVDYLETAEIDSLYRIHDPSGVVIIVQEEGAGSRPNAGNVVYTNYVGSLMSDGSVFDTNIEQVAKDNDLHVEGSSTYRILNFSLGTGQVIQGWDIAFRRLRPGSKARLVIPSTWGYRNSENNERIPPNSVLIFDVEFLGMD
ncbi:FKBP-type peptidyl-prolyl cis-trans isomerase [Algoriphagus sp. AGSA1]|uniref:FKBP-type peptidyl-prolyl cis-trans isomerase n=1 Tax=Algoriphagus sp. AGSA1 TaxID=2907213 RepID=UPI001F22D562|nr:FKBP-type peptidyl-prolyl cis-trans isomerase [Algoriphagus sp. AGSA1]MCE7055018.1 FKBP-type peptidyl-prolyl cis-trans isomerase [Algoriphagus sp. AGSA1]